jgi:hypothetical protein
MAFVPKATVANRRFSRLPGGRRKQSASRKQVQHSELKTPPQSPVKGYWLHRSVEKEIFFNFLDRNLIQVLHC